MNTNLKTILHALPHWKKIGLLFLFWWTGLTAIAGKSRAGASKLPLPSSAITQLLERITRLQVTRDGFFYAGMFPTMRAWAYTPTDIKPDNSIFFTGLIVFTLRQLETLMTPGERVLSDSIIDRALKAYPHYSNTSGAPTYNFWPNDRVEFFPNSKLMGLVKESKRIADDLDDTSILWLGTGIPDSTAKKLKALMEAHANGRNVVVQNSYDEIRDLPAYSAWFSRKTPVELDAGVMCNILYFVNAAGLPYSVYDSGTVSFLRFILDKKKYLEDPAFASSYYPRTPVLIYHFARLLGRYPQAPLAPFIPALKKDARDILGEMDDWMDKVILGTSLIRLGDTAALPDFNKAVSFEDIEEDPFVFYIANLSSLYPNPVRRTLLHNPFCIYQFHCPAYNDALLLEYLVLRRSLMKQ